VSNVKAVERVAIEPEEDGEPPARLSDRALRDAFLSRLAKRRVP
jgi:hypothetical protein